LWPVVALGEWLAVYRSFPIRTRTFSTHLVADGIACMIGATFLSPMSALFAVFCGNFVANLQHPRSMRKKVVTSTMVVMSLALMMLTYHELLGITSPVNPLGWLCVAAALVVYAVVDAVGVVGYLVLTNGWASRPPLKDIGIQLAVDVIVNSAGSVIAITLVWSSTLAVILLAGTLTVMTLGRRMVARAQHQDKTVKEVFRHIGNMAASEGGEAELVPAILEEARTLLTASKASLMAPLRRPLDGMAVRWSLAGDGPAAYEEGLIAAGVAPLVNERGPLVARRGDDDHLLLSALEAEGVQEAVAVPLSPTGAIPGYLLVGDRPYAHEGFGEEDVKLLETVAANAEMVLKRTGIMERLRSESSARMFEAYHDHLTGLPNRANFSQRLERVIREAGKETRVGLLLLDLDGFKQVNETLGFRVGDEMLAKVGRRLARLAKPGALVARVGGDEFVLVLEDAPSDQECIAKAEEMVAVASRPMTINNFELVVGASVGVVVEPARQTNAGRLLRKADVAMYRAKSLGGGASMYEAASDSSSLRRLSLATELRKALEAGELQLHYQPVIEVASGSVISFEALARWSHDQYGPIAPDEFIPVAERSGLIDALTWWALESALDQLKEWRAVVPGLGMAVNLSARSLASPGLVQRVERLLSSAHLVPNALRLELTESSVTSDAGHGVIADLSALGVRLSIDDFGTGYSSLSRLRELPFDEVKIDKSFVSDMCLAEDDEAVVRSIIHLAQGLDKVATAEGVEDKRTLERLAALGCHAAQGYYLSRPLPAQQCSGLLLASYSPRGPRGVPDLGTAALGTASSGTASSGTASSGTASSGTASSGTASSGTASSGAATLGIASLGRAALEETGSGSAGAGEETGPGHEPGRRPS
jgi:diguanylate cyclase (GGDEF)-like protein